MDPDKWARGPERPPKKYTSLTPPAKIFGRFGKPEKRPAIPLPEHAHIHYHTSGKMRVLDANNVPQMPVKGTAKVVTIDIDSRRPNNHFKTESPSKVLRVFYGQIGPSDTGDDGKIFFGRINSPPTVVLLCRTNSYYNSARVGHVGHFDKGKPRRDLPQLVLDMPQLQKPAGKAPKVVWNIEYTNNRAGRVNSDKFVFKRMAELKGIDVLVVRVMQRTPTMGKWLSGSPTYADESERHKFLEALATGICSILARHVNLRVIFIDTLKGWKSTGTDPHAWVNSLRSASKPSLRLLQFVSKVGDKYNELDHRHNPRHPSARLGAASAQSSTRVISDLIKRFEVMAESDYQRKYRDWKLEKVLDSELEPRKDS